VGGVRCSLRLGESPKVETFGAGTAKSGNEAGHPETGFNEASDLLETAGALRSAQREAEMARSENNCDRTRQRLTSIVFCI
jgi:hypothetical protein